MSERIIEFPDRIHRQRLIAAVEADNLFIAVSSFGVTVITFALLGMGGEAFMVGLGVGGLVTYVYVYYKERFKRGFFTHWCYVKNYRYPKYEGEEGLPKDFLPEGYENEFRD